MQFGLGLYQGVVFLVVKDGKILFIFDFLMINVIFRIWREEDVRNFYKIYLWKCYYLRKWIKLLDLNFFLF